MGKADKTGRWGGVEEIQEGFMTEVTFELNLEEN